MNECWYKNNQKVHAKTVTWITLGKQAACNEGIYTDSEAVSQAVSPPSKL